MVLASLSAPELIVLVILVPPPDDSTKGVPDTVRLVTVPVFHTVAVAEPDRAILPVPKSSVLALEFELLNTGVVNVYDPNVKVPAVNV